MPVAALKPEGWNLEQPEVHALMDKMRGVGTSLGEYVYARLAKYEPEGMIAKSIRQSMMKSTLRSIIS
jgi:hypothetical protein